MEAEVPALAELEMCLGCFLAPKLYCRVFAAALKDVGR